MIQKTLLVSRSVNNHDFYKEKMDELGFADGSVTSLEKDALNFHIDELKPDLLIMDARFYQCCTPFLMGELHKKYPDIKMAAFVIGDYPVEIAMYFILNKVNSYATTFDGLPVFYKGLEEIRKGKKYVSPEVLKRIATRRTHPAPAGNITGRHREIIRLACNGWKDLEIADTLHISRCTVARHKCVILTSLNVRSVLELIHVALRLEIVTIEELCFHHNDLILNPLPAKKIKGRSKE
jgi:DNA-binding NarL/FixJ family response regulator